MSRSVKVSEKFKEFEFLNYYKIHRSKPYVYRCLACYSENYPKIHTVAPDAKIMSSTVSSEGLYSSKNRSTLYFDSKALIPCKI